MKRIIKFSHNTKKKLIDKNWEKIRNLKQSEQNNRNCIYCTLKNGRNYESACNIHSTSNDEVVHLEYDFCPHREYLVAVQRDFLKTRFSRCMLYICMYIMHNAAIGTD